MSAEITDIAALALMEPEETHARLRKVSLDEKVGVALIDEGGVVTFATVSGGAAAGTDIGAEPEVAAALSSGRGDARRGDMIYAARRLSEGGVIRLSAPAPQYLDSLGSGAMVALSLLTLLVAVAHFVLIRYLMAGLRLNVLRASQLLEAFAEGRFEERILGVPNHAKRDVAPLNAAADRIEDQLVRQRRRNQALGAVMNQIQTGILAVDEQLRIILITPAAKQLLGISGGAEGFLVSDASKDVRLDQVLKNAMQQDGVYTNEVLARTGTGRNHRPLRLYVSAMRQDDGAALGALALVEDITEFKRMEQVRNDFVANVSHELKTPLTSIRGFAETLQEGAIQNPEMADKFLKIIMLETERLSRLINDILAITKLESGSDEVLNARVRLDQMTFDVADMLRLHAQEKGVTVHTQLGDDPVYIWGNPDRVRQMLINLIENGIKYNQPGGSVTASIFTSEDAVQLLVSDTGIGIAEEHIPRLFERFYRVDKGRSRNMGGTGLGLAIIKHIIRGMGGMIEVHSKLGEGTEFLVTLPPYQGEADDGGDGSEDEAEGVEE